MTISEGSPGFAADFPRCLDALDGRLASFEQRLAAVSERLDRGAPAGDPAGSHLLFVPSATGYELVAGSGPLPVVGSDVQLHGPGGPRFAVVKIGPSPLPADRRPCVYLELG